MAMGASFTVTYWQRTVRPLLLEEEMRRRDFVLRDVAQRATGTLLWVVVTGRCH